MPLFAENTKSPTVAQPPSIGSTGFRRFLLLLALYLAAHAAIRLSLSKSLEFDEAEQIILTQSLATGYSEQPPLYTWLLWALVQLFGVNVFSLAVLKIGLLAGAYLLLYRVASSLLRDARLACLAAFSPLLVPVFAWEAIRLLTHTILLCVVSLATLLTLLRLRERSRTADFALLGCWLGLGMLSKYNYALFVAALTAAALSLRSFRVRLQDRRLVLSLVVAVALVAPHAHWLINHWQEAHEYLRRHTHVDRTASVVAAFAAGVGHLFYNLTLGLGLLAAAGLTFFPRGFTVACPSEATDDGRRLLGRLFLAALVLLVFLVIAGGVRHFRLHWFAPLLLLLPVWFFGRLEGVTLPRWRLGGYAAVLATAALGVVLVRTAALCCDFDAGKHKTRDFLYAEQAVRVRSMGFENGTVVVFDPLIGAYQRLYFAAAPVHCLRYPSCPHPAKREPGPVLAIWDATVGDAMPQPLSRYLADQLGQSQPAAAHFVEVAPRRFDRTTHRLGFLLLRERGVKKQEAAVRVLQ